LRDLGSARRICCAAQCPRERRVGKIVRHINANRHLSANDFAHPTRSMVDRQKNA